MKNIKHWIPIVIAILSIAFSMLLFDALEEQKMLNRHSVGYFQQTLNELQDTLLLLEYGVSPSTAPQIEKQYYYGEFDSESQTIQLTISVKPLLEDYAELEAILHCNGKDLPLVLLNGMYSLTYAVPIFETQKISAITWIDGDIAQTDILAWTINPVQQLVPEYFSYELGSSYMDGENGKVYDFEIYFFLLNLPEQFGPIREINLIEILDGVEYKKTPINYSLRNPLKSGSLSIKTATRGTVAANTTMEIVMQIVDENNFKYNFLIQKVSSDELIDWLFSGGVSVLNDENDVLYAIN